MDKKYKKKITKKKVQKKKTRVHLDYLTNPMLNGEIVKKYF
jgi:hypothetical protein